MTDSLPHWLEFLQLRLSEYEQMRTKARDQDRWDDYLEYDAIARELNNIITYLS